MTPPPALLSEDAILTALQALPQWQTVENALVREADFPDFLRLIQCVNAIAHLAERQDHHPDFDIRYTRLVLRYWTHTAGGVTQLDITGAREAESLLHRFLKPASSLTDPDEAALPHYC